MKIQWKNQLTMLKLNKRLPVNTLKLKITSVQIKKVSINNKKALKLSSRTFLSILLLFYFYFETMIFWL
ncbi:hypothetical protein SAMN05421594_3882 [Chryseobacterium oleae]|uniref:Uncharacterized protein n=1 Tax=Chryseobacterium oleae TaxID=491207 RepID=A0A1I5B9F9_CHROL|nr:hypothetical protein SAMN05421594_3882 [Chryseobacterium oleae]